MWKMEKEKTNENGIKFDLMLSIEVWYAYTAFSMPY